MVTPVAPPAPTDSPTADPGPPPRACEQPGYSAAKPPVGSFRVAFTCGKSGTLLVPRTGPATVENALRQLLAGPTEAEQADGFGSFFGPETAGLLRGVSAQGKLLIVDIDERFAEIRSNASTSYGSMVFLGELTETLRGFNDRYSEVEFRLGGSCERFHAFLQGSCRRIPLRSND